MDDDLFFWPEDGPTGLRDGLTVDEVATALYAPESERMDNRTPAGSPTFLVVCAPVGLRLIVVICTRPSQVEPWTVVIARHADATERAMWRKHTS